MLLNVALAGKLLAPTATLRTHRCLFMRCKVLGRTWNEHLICHLLIFFIKAMLPRKNIKRHQQTHPIVPFPIPLFSLWRLCWLWRSNGECKVVEFTWLWPYAATWAERAMSRAVSFQYGKSKPVAPRCRSCRFLAL